MRGGGGGAKRRLIVVAPVICMRVTCYLSVFVSTAGAN